MGASVFSWGVLGLMHAGPDARWSVPRLGVAALNFAAGLLLVARAPVAREPWGIGVAIPSMIAAGWAFKLIPAPATWPWWASGLFAAGTLWTLWAFAVLGRSFDLFPSRGALADHGPYAVMRHPAYAGELLLILACWLAAPRWEAAAPLALVIPALAGRIAAEENLLRADPAYVAYCDRVPWRILPGLW